GDLLHAPVGMADDVRVLLLGDVKRSTSDMNGPELSTRVTVHPTERVIESTHGGAGHEESIRTKAESASRQRSKIATKLVVEHARGAGGDERRIQDVVVGEDDVRGEQKGGAAPLS